LYDNTPGSQYFLKLFIPVSNYTKPSEIFKYNLKLDANGEYNVSGTKSIDIVDVYMDNDADGIPNAWDLHPEYFDANANGILDGNETTLLTSSSYISFLPNNVSSFSSTPIYSSGSASNCSSAPTYRYTYQSSTESDSIMNSIPFNLNGTLNLSSNTRTFIPKLTSIGDKLVTVKFKVEKLNSSCNVESTTNTNVYYIKTGSNYIRQLPYWSTNASTALSQKLNFIHGYNSGGTVSLNRSEELYALIGTTNGAFHPDNKVQR